MSNDEPRLGLLAGSAAGEAAVAALREAGIELARDAAVARIVLVVDHEPPTGEAAVLLHRSLLPAFRGPDPVRRALLAGAEQTGWSAARVVAGAPLAGPVVLRRAVRIRTRETGAALRRRLDGMLPGFVVELAGLLAGGLPEGEPQDEASATAAPPIVEADGRIDWSTMRPATVFDRIRALCDGDLPAWSVHRGERILLLAGEPAPGTGQPGVVEAAGPGGIRVALPGGGVRLLRLGRADGSEIAPLEFPRRFPVGSVFCS